VPASPSLPNVIFVMTDQQRADSHSPEVARFARYPALEQLRSESVEFTRFYTAASPCAPSRHVFLTGRNEWLAGSSGNGKFLVGDQVTWMSLLRDRGYRCVSIGKTHMVHAGSFHVQIPVGLSFADETQSFNHFKVVASPEPEEAYFDVQVATRARETLKLLKAMQPFALFVGFHGPHQPYVVPRRYMDFVKPHEVPLPAARSPGEHLTKSKPFNKKRERLMEVRGGELDEEALRTGIAGYYCLLKVIDDGLGGILEEIKDLGLADRSLVYFASDHGELLGDHGIFNKGASFYEGEVRVPFMVRFPGAERGGSRVDSLASSLDFVPTLMEMLALDPDISLPGRSLLPAVDGGATVRDAVMCSTGAALMVRTDRHKLWYDAHENDGEMYDLDADPNELRNLFGSNAHRGIRASLMERMLRTRVLEDVASNSPTQRELRLRDELKTSLEPEILIKSQMPPEFLSYLEAQVRSRQGSGGT
jgi:arylsulfatase A-like enzyme